ncbi:hypothetical protein [Permianibacter aggregans]|uniref:Peptidase S41-like protein n=1 Tax=Permianibacter aggregans TaxID=1510150 RepID=A0A4R6UU74_9GAMM|nr:hypothetical protein [Permianibacter aggregans]QGX40547.1 hypothetical protein E2H98_13060 [Permianibacter aggregans]TDQ49303.1 hypothetical protein EV696_1047 [Permianibacter aggregans]
MKNRHFQALLLALTFTCPTLFADGSTSSNREADLAIARDEFVLKSLSFSDDNRQKALKFLDDLQPQLNRLSNEAYLLAMLKTAAFAGNGHDMLITGKGWHPSQQLPLRLLWLRDGVLVTRAAPAHADLLGAVVESIDGHEPETIARDLQNYRGGPLAMVRWDITWLIEQAGMLHAMGLAKAPDRLQFRLRKADGSLIERSVLFVPKSAIPDGMRPHRQYSMQPNASEQQKGWQTMRVPTAEPWYLQQAELPYRLSTDDQLNALLLQLRLHFDTDGHSLSEFIEQAIAAIEKNSARHLIVDLRFDLGGNVDLTQPLRPVIAKHPFERIVVLTGPHTLSAGIIMAAELKQLGRERVTIIGDEVGDTLRFWSEGQQVCLPHSQYCFIRSTGVWDLQHGCAGEPACYGDRFDVRVESLKPDIYAPLTVAALRSGRDPAMEAAAELLNSR